MELYRPLVITNLSAKDLADMRRFGRMMVYAVASVTGGTSSAEFTTALDTDGERNPKWNTRIQFNLHNPSFQNNCLSLHIHFYCRLTSTDAKYLGGVKVPAKSLIDLIISRNMSTSAFHTVRYPVVCSSRGEQGVVQFSFAFPQNPSRPQPPTRPQRSQHPQLRQPVPQSPGPSQRPFSQQPRQQPPSHPRQQQFPLRKQPPRLRPSHQPFHPPPPRHLPSQTQLFPQRPSPPQSSQSQRCHIVYEQQYEVSMEQIQGLRISQTRPTYNQPNDYNATAHSNVNVVVVDDDDDEEEEEEEEEEGGHEYDYGNVEGYGNHEDNIRSYGDEDNNDGDEEKEYNYRDGDGDEEDEDQDYSYYNKGY